MKSRKRTNSSRKSPPKSAFNHEKFQVHPTRLQQEIQELECFYLNQVVCAGGVYDRYDGATEWTQAHDSTTERDHLRIYTRTRHTGETEYRLFTKVNTVTPRDYLELQTNVELRATWDTWIKSIGIVDTLTDSSWNGRDEGVVIRWVQKMPAFLSAREYIYIREVFHNRDEKLIAIVARECDYPDHINQEKGVVRVDNYRSVTVITYEDFDQPGFTSMLTYHDSVSKCLPKMFLKWSASRGFRDSQNKLLDQAENIAEKRKI